MAISSFTIFVHSKLQKLASLHQALMLLHATRLRLSCPFVSLKKPKQFCPLFGPLFHQQTCSIVPEQWGNREYHKDQITRACWSIGTLLSSSLWKKSMPAHPLSRYAFGIHAMSHPVCLVFVYYGCPIDSPMDILSHIGHPICHPCTQW